MRISNPIYILGIVIAFSIIPATILWGSIQGRLSVDSMVNATLVVFGIVLLLSWMRFWSGQVK